MQPSSSDKRLLWDALLSACNVSPDEVNGMNRVKYQEAARALHASGATPDEIHRRALVMRHTYTVPITPTFVATHFAEFARAQRVVVKAGLFFHPDNCDTPCIGCAADRKASNE